MTQTVSTPAGESLNVQGNVDATVLQGTVSTTLKNVSFLGRCYDILTLDPLHISATAQDYVAIDLGKAQPEPITGEGSLKPTGTTFTPGAGADYGERSEMIFSAYDFQCMFSQTVGLSIGIPKIASFSGSASYKRFQQETASRRNMFTLTEIEVVDHTLKLDYPKGPSDSAETGWWELGAEFRQRVNELPNSRSTPAEKKAYQQFIQDFGTHYSERVVFGGRAYQQIRISMQTYSSLVKQGVKISAEASGTFKKVTGGAKSATEVEQSKEFQSETQVGQEDIVWSGGVASRDFDQWLASIKQDPAPVEMTLTPLSELLTPMYFPSSDSPNPIVAKRQALREAIDEYIVDQGTAPQASVAYGPSRVLDDQATEFATVAVAVNDSGSCISLSAQGSSHDLYYSVGRIDVGNEEISWGGKARYDSGLTASVAMDNQGHCVEFHGLPKLYYRLGSVDFDFQSIAWGKSNYYDTAASVAIALDDNGTLVEVHRHAPGSNDQSLYWRTGTVDFDKRAIDWRSNKPSRYADGQLVTVAMNHRNIVLEMHRDAGGANNQRLWYTLGHIDDDYQITWGKPQYFDLGLDVSVALDDSNNCLATFVGPEESEPLYYRRGVLSATGSDPHLWTLQWTERKPYDTGRTTAIALDNRRNLVEAHSGATGVNKLFYHVGRMRDVSSITVGE